MQLQSDGDSWPGGLDQLAEVSAGLLELVGIGAILLGSMIATAIFVRRIVSRRPFSDSYLEYRRGLGRAILLGLEFLVGADIIGTVAVAPSFRNLGVLAAIVLVRTFLSFALEVEIDGRWPWRRGSEREA